MKNNEATTIRLPRFNSSPNRKEARSSAESTPLMTRKEKDAKRKRMQRANETSEEKEKRNEKMRLDARRKRSSENSESSLERLRRQQLVDKTRRHSETAEQNQSRLVQQRSIDATRRENETGEEYRSRLDQPHLNDIVRRSNETPEERTARVRSDSRRRQQRATEKKNNPPVKPWPAAISEQVKQQCLAEFNKKMSMDKLREQVCVVCNSRHNETTMHRMSLSDVNVNLFKPHHSLHGTIPETRSAHSSGKDFGALIVLFLTKLRCRQVEISTTFFFRGFFA